MTTLRTLLIALCLVFTFGCETEAVETEDFLLSRQNNASNTNSDDPDEEEEDETEEEEEDTCETLFAFGDNEDSTCFIDDGFNRWGWTIGPITDGDYTFDLYAGAGQCDTERGTHVGALSVTYNETEGTVDVNFDMLEGFVLNETHLYIGNDPYPIGNNGQDTVAPGQYPYQNQLEDASSDSYSISDISGEIYIIAHGVVCDAPDDEEEDDEDDDDDGGNVGAF